MHGLTDLIFLLVAVDSILNNPQSALLYDYFPLSLKSDYPAFKFLPPCLIQNLWTPHCSRLWSLLTMNVYLFMIWATLLSKLSLMLGGLQSMSARSGLLLGMILDMRCHGYSIYTAQLGRSAALTSYVLFGLKFLAIHQSMGPTQWWNTYWQKLTSQSEKN